MASFLTGPAAQLVGAGMQAIGVGIPVGQTSAKLIEGMRDCGLPVPPKSWFKRKAQPNEELVAQAKQPKPNVYDKLEAHIHGVIQVVKPAIELKNIVRNGCMSADRLAAPTQSSKEELQYYTPQRHYTHDRDFNSPQRAVGTSNKPRVQRDYDCHRRLPSISDDDQTCMYCSRSEPLLELPCGRLICHKCNKANDHMLKLNMPITRRNTTTNMSKPLDIIDLTQDSPSNKALRRSRTDNPIVIEELQAVDESIIIEQDLGRSSRRKQRLVNPSGSITIEETITLDDTISNPNTHQPLPVLDGSKNNKHGLCCPICLENLADNNDLKAMTTPCGHVYCLECLKTVTKANKKCSMCKRPLTFAKCIRLHI